MMDSRLTELEIKISFTEDQLDELNKVIYRQQQQIDLLIGEMRALRDQVVINDQPQQQRNLRDEIPPHY